MPGGKILNGMILHANGLARQYILWYSHFCFASGTAYYKTINILKRRFIPFIKYPDTINNIQDIIIFAPI